MSSSIKNIRRLLLPGLFGILLVHTVWAQNIKLPKQEQVHLVVRYYETVKGFNGNILVAENGKVMYENSMGWADLEAGKPLTLNTPFYLASVSKQFTAASILMLRDKGKLSLDDFILKYLPELGEYAKKITIRHLLNHSSGLPDYFQMEWDITGYTNAQLYNQMVSSVKQLNFRPGHKYRYNNTGYVFLSLIVEKVSELPYYKFVESRITEPLGMGNTWVFDIRNDRVGDWAVGYTDNLRKRDEYYLLTTGDGGIFSTLEDLFIWDQALYTDELLSTASLEEAFSPLTLPNGITGKNGFGWVIGSNLNGKTVSHSGGLAGFRAYIERQVEVNNTIIILNNNSSEDIMDMRNILVKILDGRPYELPGTEK